MELGQRARERQQVLRTAIASAGAGAERAVIVSARVAIVRGSKQLAVRAGVPATLWTSAKPGELAIDAEVKRVARNRVGALDSEVLLCADGSRLGSAAVRRRHGHNDDTAVAATANRAEKAKGRTVLQAIQLHMYTLRTFMGDESSRYMSHMRTSSGV